MQSKIGWLENAIFLLVDVAPPQLYLMTIIVTLLSSEYAVLKIVNPRKDPTFVQFEKDYDLYENIDHHKIWSLTDYYNKRVNVQDQHDFPSSFPKTNQAYWWTTYIVAK
jgi:hypothetical protein